jgi:CDP-paratose 2-epimerase
VSIAIITGVAGLVGAACARLFGARGLHVIGVDNDMRRYFFGEAASTRWSLADLGTSGFKFTHVDADIRDQAAISRLFQHHGRDISVVIHCAAQPSHDWAAREPVTDFTVNANGTLNLLEACRSFAPDASFIFVSTNKVYGDRPNHLPLIEQASRYELDPAHEWGKNGIPEEMSIDSTLHSLFGASKVAADILVQEYGRYFGMNTVCFRGGCLTGPGHSGAQLHGFLAYLVKCALTSTPYTVLGYKGKQVRDNIHADDLAAAFWCYFQRPISAAVFNIGGGRQSNCSMLEAISMAEEVAGRPMNWSYADESRRGDHIWWISDTRRFRQAYPEWNYRFGIREIMEDVAAGLRERIICSA